MIELGDDQLPEDIELQDDVEELDEISQPVVRYYESPKILGKLYRAIDEQKFFREIQNTPRAHLEVSEAKKSVLDRVWAYVEQKTALIQWQHYIEFAKDIKEKYAFSLLLSVVLS